MSEKGRKNRESTIGEAIERLLKAYRLDDKMVEMNVISAWEELMGKAVAMRTTSLFIHDGVLRVTMNSAVMRDELAAGKQVIILRVNEHAGKELIRDVWFD
jgi:predicted nucleic acid-binding Zn ribbon protein